MSPRTACLRTLKNLPAFTPFCVSGDEYVLSSEPTFRLPFSTAREFVEADNLMVHVSGVKMRKTYRIEGIDDVEFVDPTHFAVGVDVWPGQSIEFQLWPSATVADGTVYVTIRQALIEVVPASELTATSKWVTARHWSPAKAIDDQKLVNGQTGFPVDSIVDYLAERFRNSTNFREFTEAEIIRWKSALHETHGTPTLVTFDEVRQNQVS